MKKYLIPILTLLLLVSYNGCFAQLFTGTIMDAASRKNIPFVNIGIIGKSAGTVSNDNGQYEITLNDKYNNDSIRFSMIGYSPLTYKVSEFKLLSKNNNFSVSLEPATFGLDEVVVKPKKRKEKIAGHKFDNKNVILGLATDHLGCEVAAFIHIKKQRSSIHQININLAKNPFDSVVFRINLYSSKNGLPDKNILKQPIYATTKIKSGTVSVNVDSHHLIVDDSFFVSVQWISGSKKETLNFCSGIGGKAFMRTSSEDLWLSNDGFGLGFYCNISY